MKNFFAGIIIGVLLIGGGFFFFTQHSQQKQEVVKEVPTIVDTGYKNATYMIEDQPITLEDGLSEIAVGHNAMSKITTKYFGNVASGDLNGDGVSDVAFLLTQEGGGSGTFYYVVAALKTPTGYQGSDAILLGDRIAPQTTEIRNGEVIVNYADRKPTDPMTMTPSISMTKHLKISSDKGSGITLIEVK